MKRICKITLECSRTLAIEDKSIVRTIKQYEKDVKSSSVLESDIKEKCVFNDIDDFHVVENGSVDLMHDLLEGVCIYVMQSVINSFVSIKNCFTLQLLNHRIQNFEWDSRITNKPQIISESRFKKGMSMKMSAAEMLTFVRYFGLIIGDQVPKEDECWKLYLYLRRIIDIVTSPRVIAQDAKDLEKLIEKHNSLYLHLFGALKPKFHILTHYPRLLLELGPFVNFWSMRPESRHHQLKVIAEITNCKKNLLKTIATKQVFMMCQLINSLEPNNEVKFESQNKNGFYNFVEICNTKYSVGTFVVSNFQKSEIEFGQIEKISKVEEKLVFHLKIFEEIIFDSHVHAYIVQSTNKTECVNPDNLPKITPCLSVTKKNVHYIATQYKL